MATQMNTAWVAGKCAECGTTIGKGDSFVWGKNRGDRVHPMCLNNTSDPAKNEPDTSRNWSEFQLAVFDFLSKGTGSAIVEAVAGSGKTTTIKEAAKRLPAGITMKYIVFNRRNAEEATAVMPDNTDVQTFHSAGYRGLLSRSPRPVLNKTKMFDIERDLVNTGVADEWEMKAIGSDVHGLVSLGKSFGIGVLQADTFENWLKLVDHFGIEFEANGVDATPRGIELAQKFLAESNRRENEINYDDMIYMAVRLQVPLTRFDIVAVDEAQDTNPIRRALLKMLLKPGGRLIAVGDPRQAIYGFTGADSDAMDLIASDFNTTRLPLSVNYRCSKAVLELAAQYCPDIQACETAPDGSVETVPTMLLKDFQPTDAILCRVNAPLVTLAYRLIGAGIPCEMRGRDFGAGLISLIKKMQGKRRSPLTIEELEDRLNSFQQREYSKWMAKGEEDKAQSAEDKVASIVAVIDQLPEVHRTVAQLIERIENLFGGTTKGEETTSAELEAKPRVILSSCHKAKGLEWETVYVLDPHRMPSKWARKEWQMAQERNLIYVAYTRAKVNLRFIDGETIRSEEADA